MSKLNNKCKDYFIDLNIIPKVLLKNRYKFVNVDTECNVFRILNKSVLNSTLLYPPTLKIARKIS